MAHNTSMPTQSPITLHRHMKYSSQRLAMVHIRLLSQFITNRFKQLCLFIPNLMAITVIQSLIQTMLTLSMNFILPILSQNRHQSFLIIPIRIKVHMNMSNHSQ